ncbi:MAG: PqqD family protein [Candidatus Cloacimonetes bacterium]|nr:PqqD family protein [Candidatus Cloacimonadota bacterium]
MKQYFKPNEPNVISEPMEEELVVINLESGCYFSLNRSAAAIWKQMEKGFSIEDILKSRKSATKTDQEISHNIEEFFDFMQEEKLIIPAEGSSEDVMSEAIDYEQPEMEKFSDMQEMLLLDPIHEVSEMGWPNEPHK